MTSSGAPPLQGLRILVTRRPEQASELSRRLAEQGAEVVEIAALTIQPPVDPSSFDRALSALDLYDWLVLTSANAVDAVSARLAMRGIGIPESVQVAAVGPATARAVESAFGRPADLQPDASFRAEGLAEALAAVPLEGRRVLLPVSDRARDTLAAALRSRKAEVDVVIAYRTVAAPDLAERLRAALAAPLDVVTLASPSAVESFVGAAGPRATELEVAVIGPVTEQAARRAGLRVAAVASPSTATGLVAALAERFRGRRGR